MNPFKQPSRTNHRNDSYVTDRYSKRTENKKENVTSNNTVTNKEANFETNDFPDLFLNSNASHTEPEKLKEEDFYSNILKKEIVKEDTNKDTIPKGWVSLKFNKETRKIEKKYNPSDWALRENIKNKSCHYIMNNIVKKIEQNESLYKRYYDDFNGEGSYDALYRPYLYTEDELVSDSDSETDIDEFLED